MRKSTVLLIIFLLFYFPLNEVVALDKLCLIINSGNENKINPFVIVTGGSNVYRM